MTLKNTILKTTAIFIVVFSFIGCENDFDPIGSEIIGGPGFNSELYDEAEISAYTAALEAVQTNNLTFSSGQSTVRLHLLGFYKDAAYGAQTANVYSQLSLSNENPNFGNEPVVDSVVLSIPYFSTEGAPNDDGETAYKLDSIYGNSPIKLSIHESKFFLNTYDPATGFENAQKYYSDMQPAIENNFTGEVLFENDSFKPSSSKYVYYEENSEGEKDTVTVAPRMRLKLSNKFFQEKLLNKAGSAELSSNNSFQNFVRGLYFKAEAVGSDGTMMLLDFSGTNADITVYYTSKEADLQDLDEDEDTEELIDVQDSYRLGFGSNSMSTFQQEDPTMSNDNLYLKGGEGSMAVINLFPGSYENNNEPSEDLKFLRENEWLINEANLIFHVNQQEVGGGREPERLYLYDLKNNIRLADYSLDNNQGQLNAWSANVNRGHLGVLERDDDGKGISYKLRITEHIRRILKEDSTNVKLGLVVSQNVNLLKNSAVRKSTPSGIDRVPSSSLITPLGTVLYGPNADNEEKRLKLQIYYTEPKN
jgi:hypothetical protein